MKGESVTPNRLHIIRQNLYCMNMQQVTFRQGRPEDSDAACSLIGSQILSSPLFLKPLKQLFSQIPQNGEAVIAQSDGKAIGAAAAIRGLAYSNGKTDFFTEMQGDFPGEDLWTIIDIAVSPDFRGMKIGSELFSRMLQALKDRGCRHAMMEIWVRSNGWAPARNLVHLAPGFRSYGILDDFYIDDPFPCDFCHGECHCKAEVVVLDL